MQNVSSCLCSLKHREVSQSNLQQYGYDEAKTRDEQIQGKLEACDNVNAMLQFYHAVPKQCNACRTLWLKQSKDASAAMSGTYCKRNAFVLY